MTGVSALPLILTQCDAVISLLDDQYYNRAWCSLEVMMAQSVKKSYNLHLWYEQVLSHENTVDHIGKGFLRDGPMDKEIVMTEKYLSLENDRPKVLFLERQSRLL